MCPARLKIVARNDRSVSEDQRACRRPLGWPDPDTTNLSDEHLNNIWRLNGLGEFNRADWARQHGFVQWKILNKRLMDERDAMMTPEQLEERRIAAEDPNCWMCGGGGECEQYNEEANYEETITCPECLGSGKA